MTAVELLANEFFNKEGPSPALKVGSVCQEDGKLENDVHEEVAKVLVSFGVLASEFTRRCLCRRGLSKRIILSRA